MTRTDPVSFLGSEFNDFLFASIGEDGNGMELTVLSAFARRDVDPWLAAAELARLPGETATQKLIILIAALRDVPSARLDPGAIAVRLIALLPPRGRPNVQSRETLFGVGAAIDARLIVAFVIFLVCAVVLQHIVANRQSSARVDNASTASSSAPRMPLSSGR